MDYAGAAGAAAQVHAWVPDFVLQQLVQFPAQLLHQLSHLISHKHIYRANSFIYTAIYMMILLQYIINKRLKYNLRP